MSTASHIYRMETYQEAGKVPALAAFETAVRPTPILSVIRVSKTMTFLEKQRVARTNDMSKEAVCARFRAAVAAAGYKRQKDFAEALGTRGVSSISNVYKEMYYPSREMISLLYLQHRIDFNFILAGQFNQLPADVQELIFENL